MNFVCSITHTLIKKNDNVRIFFIQSNNDPIFPFMNYHSPTSTNNFVPLGCAFKAKLAHSENNEYFEFEMDKTKSPVVDSLLTYINERIISKNEAKKLDLLSFNSKDIDWLKIKSLQDLFIRCNKQSVYLKNHQKNINPFVTAMIIHEAAYKMIIKHCNIEKALANYKENTKEDSYIQNKKWIDTFIKKERSSIELLKGKTHKHLMKETLMYDQSIFEILMGEISNYKNHSDFKYRELYKKIEQEEKNKIGTKQTINIRRERFVDDDYIKLFMDDTINHIQKNNKIEATAFKKATENLNSENFVAMSQISNLLINNQFKKSKWLPIFEIYLIEVFLTANGYEFLPSRRHYKYQQIQNKEFFKELIELKVFR